MPVCLNGNTPSEFVPGASRPNGRVINASQEWARRCVNIGLINNMPDAALEATERQFFTLLDSAADGILLRLSLYAFPDVPRNDAGRQRIQHFYSGLESLWSAQLDGLIVTGREPQTPNLKDEPYWGSLSKVLDWADENTHSTVWSCLAAHAALLHMDGIVRRKSTEKRSGVFDCIRLSDHPLLAGMSSRFKVPHSRWNDLSADELTACGYSVLTQAQDAGADTIVKHRNSLFVFFQGHPEYEPDTLLLEYRRDVRRYLTGETGTYPSMPQGYFDEGTVEALAALQKKATSSRNEDLLASVATVLDGKAIEHSWRSSAAKLYSNWLDYISEQKERRSSQGTVLTSAHA